MFFSVLFVFACRKAKQKFYFWKISKYKINNNNNKTNFIINLNYIHLDFKSSKAFWPISVFIFDVNFTQTILQIISLKMS